MQSSTIINKFRSWKSGFRFRAGVSAAPDRMSSCPMSLIFSPRKLYHHSELYVLQRFILQEDIESQTSKNCWSQKSEAWLKNKCQWAFIKSCCVPGILLLWYVRKARGAITSVSRRANGKTFLYNTFFIKAAALFRFVRLQPYNFPIPSSVFLKLRRNHTTTTPENNALWTYTYSVSQNWNGASKKSPIADSQLDNF